MQESTDLKTVTPDLVKKLIHFSPGKELQTGLAEQQLSGTVAVHNMIVRNRVAYLADEVGMGKTYIALGVMCLIRFFNPQARIVVIAPRENIQLKWVKELRNFIRLNWQHAGNSVKALQGGPSWEPVICNSLLMFAREALMNPDRDFFLRMTSFSLRLSDDESRKRLRKGLRELVPWIDTSALKVRSPDTFRDAFGAALNAAVPRTDLLVIDEGHNLKHGFGSRVSNRNRVMGMAFGHPEGISPERHWYKAKAKRVLVLSATPFEESYDAVQKQFEVLGFGHARLADPGGKNLVSLEVLSDPTRSDGDKRKVMDRLMVRRVSALDIGGKKHTKNMYRREWRGGGYDVYDEPMSIDDPEQRLVVALVQKKVAEVLKKEDFNNSFQIGMLSSFESFMESLRSRGQRSTSTLQDSDNPGFVFDGEEQNRMARESEKAGIDTEAISGVAESFRERFNRSLPHPKLDLTANALRGVFETGEKALVFVRRVATVDELASRLDRIFDAWLKRAMKRALPELEGEIDRLYRRFDRDRRKLGNGNEFPNDDSESLDENRFSDELDLGGTETFFSWFFRGRGPRGVLSGAAFQRNRLSSRSAAETTLFEDDYVAWLLGYPPDVLRALAAQTRMDPSSLRLRLTHEAYSYFGHMSTQRERYPKYFVYEAYQMAALQLLASRRGAIGHHAEIILEERFRDGRRVEEEPPTGFPRPGEGLGPSTFFTEIVTQPQLRASIWPDENGKDFRASFRRREQRRELISALSRLGVSYIDLYLLALKQIGSFELGSQTDSIPGNLARLFINLLGNQMRNRKGHAFLELSQAAETFDILVAVNFPSVPNLRLEELAREYGTTLQRQVPVGRMSGRIGVNRRLVKQFRMPGFPFALVSTDVLQEGEDLHTFCRKVIHYGIAWTPSSMEQRTGRIDRVGSCFQRRYDGTEEIPTPEDHIQVYLPHLRDTVEVLQVRRVLLRLNRFFRLIHKTQGAEKDLDSRIDVAKEILEALDSIPPVEGLLESAFPIRKGWLKGELGPEDLDLKTFDRHITHLAKLWEKSRWRFRIEEIGRAGNSRAKRGIARADRDGRIGGNHAGVDESEGQEVRLELKSQVSGDAVLLKCICDVGKYDLQDTKILDRLYDLQRSLGEVKVCTWPVERERKDFVSVESDILFDPATTQLQELEELLQRTVNPAVRIRQNLKESPCTDDFRGFSPARRGDRMLEEFSRRVDNLIRKRGLRWIRSGNRIQVELWRSGRKQDVRFSRQGPLLVFMSVVLGANQVTRSVPYWRQLARRTWRKNRQRDLVAFAFDSRDRLVGVFKQPVATLDTNELLFYIDMIAKECDSFEYELTGSDIR